MSTLKWGTDARGRNYVIEYGGRSRIRWHHGEAADALRTSVRPPSPPAPAQERERQGAADDVGRVVSGAASVAQLAASLGQVATGVGAVIQAVGLVASAWEHRQARLAVEHAANVNARLDLTYRILDRWVEAHAAGDHLDLDLSHYVAREMLGLAQASDQKGTGPVIPQSLLYDVSQLRAVMAEARKMTAAQFSALRASGVKEVMAPVVGAEMRPINYAWVASLCEAPDAEWERAMASKNAKAFEETFLMMARPRSEVIRHLFSLPDPKLAVGLDLALMDARTVIVAVVAGTAGVGLAAAVAGAGIVAKLYSSYTEATDSVAKNAVRELILFAADVDRLRLLSDAWQVIEQCTRLTTDRALLALDAGGEAIPALVDVDGAAEIANVESMSTQRLPPLVAVDGSRLLPSPLTSAKALLG